MEKKPSVGLVNRREAGSTRENKLIRTIRRSSPVSGPSRCQRDAGQGTRLGEGRREHQTNASVDPLASPCAISYRCTTSTSQTDDEQGQVRHSLSIRPTVWFMPTWFPSSLVSPPEARARRSCSNRMFCRASPNNAAELRERAGDWRRMTGGLFSFLHESSLLCRRGS